MPRTRSVKWSELKLGGVVIVAVALASALILAVGGQGGFFWQRYPLYTRFDQVTGLKTGAIVRLNGMEVGKVTRVEFAGTQVEVGMQISKSVRDLVTTESEASMGTLSLLGEPIVDLTASDEGTPLPDGAFVKSGRGGGVAALATSAARGMDEASQLLADVRAGKGSVGRLFADETLETDLETLVGSASRVATHLEKGRGSLGALAQDPDAYLALESALQNLAVITDRMNNGKGPISRLVADEAMGNSLAAASSSLEQITGRLARGEGTAGKLLADSTMYDQLSGLTNRLDQLMTGLESGDGTAGQLLKDKRLYENMNQATLELRDLIADIQANPKKYLTVDLSVF